MQWANFVKKVAAMAEIPRVLREKPAGFSRASETTMIYVQVRVLGDYGLSVKFGDVYALLEQCA